MRVLPLIATMFLLGCPAAEAPTEAPPAPPAAVETQPVSPEPTPAPATTVPAEPAQTPPAAAPAQTQQ
jgi:hypothetical protein